MNNLNANTSIKYKGNVKIAFVRNGKTIKKIKINNAGNLNFFKLIARTIAGDYTAIDEMPRYLNAYIIDKNSNTNKPAITNKVKCNDVDWEVKNDVAYAKFHFLIPFNYCIDETNISSLKLEDINGNEYASITLSENISPDGKSNISILWEISIKGE